MCAGQIDPTLVKFTDECWFHLGGHANSLNIWQENWYAQNPVLILEVPLHDVKFGAWCAMSANRIIVSVL
jgi:hypothetical protein